MVKRIMSDPDFTKGDLLGEIIWITKLCMHTETDVEYRLATEEERAEYKRLNDVWFKAYHIGKNTELDKKRAEKEWKEYRNYARSLCVKYLPAEVNYKRIIYSAIEDIEQFYRGIESYLWNTDHCHYTFTKDDIVVTNKDDGCGVYYTISIKFILDDIEPIQ